MSAAVQLVGAQAWECSNTAKLQVAAMRKDVCRQTRAYAPITRPCCETTLSSRMFIAEYVVVPELL
jgi:hypothetical protein